MIARGAGNSRASGRLEISYTILLWVLFSILLTFTSSNEVVPGLHLYPNDVACCPTLPLMGPAWMVDPSSFVYDIHNNNNNNNNCSPQPSLVDRRMVLVFKSSGVVNGWADAEACHYVSGSFSIVPSSSSSSSSSSNPYVYDFHWNNWKSQPYSHCAATSNQDCSTSQIERGYQYFWHDLSHRVTTLLVTGHTNVELQDREGRTVVRLEALPESYSCHSTNHEADCDARFQLPTAKQMGATRPVPQTMALPSDGNNQYYDDYNFYSAEELAMGGGGLHFDATQKVPWRPNEDIRAYQEQSSAICESRFGPVLATAVAVTTAMFQYAVLL